MKRVTKVLVLASTVSAIAVAGVVTATQLSSATPSQPKQPDYVTNDSHVHLTNYIQEGIEIRDLLNLMGNRVGRVALFGIPLQQMWSFRLDQHDAPTYYLDTDADLYYYSFTDAHIAMAYRSLSRAEQARFDPMITGFNPADMYAADHVRRVLETFPNVFVGIGEFSIHKEFVTSKIAGEAPSLEDPALDRLLKFAEEVGLIVLVHCDIDTPFPRPGEEPAYLDGIQDLFRRHPETALIWAHIGVGRVVRPIKDQMKFIEAMLANPKLRHVYFDLSWSETAKYIVASPETVEVVADVITRYPDRFLFGTDEVAPATQEAYLRVLRAYEPLWRQLSPEVRELVRKGNYERLFDAARERVRAWEAQHRERRALDEHARLP